MTPGQALSEIDAILDACEPVAHNFEDFGDPPLKKGTYAVTVEDTLGGVLEEGHELVVVQDVSKRRALWVYLTLFRNPHICGLKFHKAAP